MCAGSIYWGNVGRVVYGISETRLAELTGADEQNPTLDLPCRVVLLEEANRYRLSVRFQRLRRRLLRCMLVIGSKTKSIPMRVILFVACSGSGGRGL